MSGEGSSAQLASAAKWFDLSNRVVMVTGAGSGLGRAIAVAVASAGARVWCTDIDAQAALEVAQVIGAGARSATLDVRRSEEVEAMFDRIDCDSGGVDVLFNNAGINGPAEALHRIEVSDWDEALEVNLRGVMLCSRAMLARLCDRQRPGKIVLTASVWGSRGVGVRAMPAYAASKGAVTNLTRELALEYAGSGITVNALAPLGFVTNIGGGATFRNPVARKDLESRIPLGRLAQPAEIAGLAVFLASPAADFMTGSVVTIDGGFSAA